MAKSSTQYVCQNCGNVTAKWSGQCPGCQEWNTLVEEVNANASNVPKGLGKAKGRKIEFTDLQTSTPIPARRLTGIVEFDRVCGGGLVPGSSILVGGDPGIGKSTLLLQVAAKLGAGHNAVYITGEESTEQVRMRAARLGLGEARMALAAATDVRNICATLDNANAADIVIIDSIQTMYLDNLDSAPGTVAQVRASAQELIRVTKQRGHTLILVGHVTKEGTIAGPRVLEHMVDAVLYFEGDRGHQFRILRAVKNRYGATDEIGVFTMGDEGLAEVANPSALFLAERNSDVTGSCVFAGMEGTRPLLVEIQALISPTSYGTPRRAVVGWDNGRLAMILAVLETRCGISFGMADVYLNVAGGLRITEPAADLAVATALISAQGNITLPPEQVVFGEIGLSGEIRSVGQTDIRLKEATKLGFTSALIPNLRGNQKTAAGLQIQQLNRLDQLVQRLLPRQK